MMGESSDLGEHSSFAFEVSTVDLLSNETVAPVIVKENRLLIREVMMRLLIIL